MTQGRVCVHTFMHDKSRDDNFQDSGERLFPLVPAKSASRDWPTQDDFCHASFGPIPSSLSFLIFPHSESLNFSLPPRFLQDSARLSFRDK